VSAVYKSRKTVQESSSVSSISSHSFLLNLTLHHHMSYIADQQFCHMLMQYIHGTRLAALSFSSYFELLFYMYSNSCGMKLKTKLLAITSYSRPTLIFA
jgi:hypothetical protein